MTIAICVVFLIGVAGSAARFAQGNGYAGPGRWSLLVICLFAAWYGLEPTTILDAALATCAGGFAAANIAFGYTKWENIPYSMARYSLPAFLAIIPWASLNNPDLIFYVAVGPVIALNMYYVGQHKPQWLINIVGDRDVATLIPGFLAAAGLACYKVL